jgi:citronellyl-CoA synthetase
MITWRMMLRKVPSIVRALPRVIRGIRAANVTDPTQPCGLGWSFEQATLRHPDGRHCCLAIVCSVTAKPTVCQPHCPSPAGPGHRQGRCGGGVYRKPSELLLSVLAVAKLGGICAMLNTAQTHIGA